MRRCKICGDEAYVMMRTPKMALCRVHYREFVERKIERVIHRYKMLKEGDRLLVAVSGGKDALATAIALKNLGYEFECLHINLGIGEHSQLSEKVSREQCEKLGIKLHILNLRELVGAGIGEVRTRRAPCSYCGMTKRYLMNKFAVDNGFNVIATGHNLDDETAFMLGNLLHWNVNYLSRQGPMLSESDKMARRIKPLYELTNVDIENYVRLFDVPYVNERCPYSEGAKSILYGKVLNEIEDESPGTKLNFVKGFLKNRELFPSEDIELKECRVCGMPSLGEVCSFCRFWNLNEPLNLKVNILHDDS